MPHRLLAALLVIVFSTALWASPESRWFIENADEATLVEMAALRGMDTDVDASELRQALLEREDDFSTAVGSLPVEEGGYHLTVLSADGMDLSPDGLVTLSGSVAVEFTLEGDEAGKTLSADHMVLDPASGRVTAYGNVSYRDSAADSGLEQIEADIVSYLYDTGELLVSGGTTTSERTNNEDEEVTFYTTGRLLSYNTGQEGLFFQDGYLTSNPDTAYSSITADSIALLSGGDMFLSDAYLSIGRVPILYLPFFFYPGSRLSINPAFGFNSSRGMFLSTTSEIFGTYPKFSTGDESSFASILRTADSADMVSNGLYYEEGVPAGGIQEWARRTDSYLALLADVYSDAGFLIGLDGKINPVDGMSISSGTSLILNRATSANYDKSFRYYSLNALSLDASYGSLDLSLPLYSDPRVYADYGSRLTSFSIDALFGASQSFPTTGTSSVTSYDAYLTGSLQLPSSMRSDLVGTLRLSSIRANASFDWNSTDRRYDISDITLPSFTFTMSGTLFSLDGGQVESAPAPEKEEVDITDFFLLADPLLYDLYVVQPATDHLMSFDDYMLSLTYSITERFSNDFQIDNDDMSVYGQEVGSTSQLSLELYAQAGRFFTLRETLTPSWSYSYDGDEESKENDFSLLSTTRASIPVLGISYELSAYLYRFSADEVAGESSFENLFFAFDRENVRRHSISLSQSLGSVDSLGQVTASLSYTLPPLQSSFTPRLSYRVGGFTSALSWSFDEKDEGGYQSADIDFSMGLNLPNVTFSLALGYDSAIWDPADFWAPLDLSSSFSLRTADKAWSITERLVYDAMDDGGRNQIDELSTTISMPWLDLAVNFRTDEDALRLEYFQLSSQIDDLTLYAWKNRIRLSLVLDGRLRYDFLNPYSSSLRIRTGFEFSIAEFLDLTVALTTTNNAFYRYTDSEGNFSFSGMFADLWRSFDFIGDGRSNTQFNMEAFDVELVHYMGDWDLHLRYTASLQSQGRDYTWVPTFAIYLSWKTIPDLKVDQTWEEGRSGWTPSSDSLYGD